jgi:hypothetical protein
VHTDGARGWAATLYEEEVAEQMPETDVLASLGCGNPPRSPICTRARRFSTSARVAAWMSSSPPGESARARPSTGST